MFSLKKKSIKSYIEKTPILEYWKSLGIHPNVSSYQYFILSKRDLKS